MRIVSLLSLTLFFILSAVYTVSGHCTENWHKFNGDCVWFSKEKETWINAYSWCQLLGGILVEGLDTAVSRNTLVELVNEEIGSNSAAKYWVGLSDVLNEGLYKWVMVHYRPNVTFWGAGQPKAADDKRNCVYIDEKGDWYTEKCKKKYRFICKRGNWSSG